ncbi:3-hydroxyisobutyryl-CoA hydrolase 1-like isoform X3 [Durio zibethinus]|uniref:3-hydroxyisobutyryl-CoA hydrolase n=1 Tax=Durio zibethinus TaxID=66656 RepID=A0A6P5YX82_DURZI|nr:3-hydroxyisobutyryl-CoA hydrolase 1-like isoform X3 [Durio zibethinus]
MKLEREVVHQMDGWISATIQTLKKVSPTSLKISLRSIREGRLQGLGPCLAVSVEWFVMSCGENSVKTFLRVAGLQGCMAMLLDKDKNSMWEPSKLEVIADSIVDCYFSMVNREEWEDLKLPTRSMFNLPPYAIAKL